MKKLVIIVLCLLSIAATKYVDSSLVTGSNDGSSWANAWRDMNSISGLSAGDTVYFSGGASGSSQVYTPNSLGPSFPGIWLPTAGTAGNRITYQIGQDASHNGTAIFCGSNVWYWLGYQGGTHDFNISGDAGDGSQHFALTNYLNMVNGTGYTNVHLSYINFGSQPLGMDFNPCQGVELDHCYIQINATNSDHAILMTPTGAGYGVNSIHNCEFHTFYGDGTSRGSGWGPDVLQITGDSFDIYSNTFISGSAYYSGGQHQDGWQGASGSNIRVYDNWFYNISDYPVYVDIFGSGYFTNLYIYNNVFIGNGAGIIIGPDAIAPSQNYVVNMVVANNTIDSGTNSIAQSMAVGTTPGKYCLYVNAFLANNVLIGGQNYNFNLWTNPVSISDLWITTAQATNYFKSYLAANTNESLIPVTSSMVGQGTNLSAYFTTDFIGVTRPSSWSIGAYEGTNAVAAISTATLSTGTVRVTNGKLIFSQ